MGASISDPQVQKMKADKDMYPYGISKMSGGTEESVVIILNGKEYTPMTSMMQAERLNTEFAWNFLEI